MQRYTIYSHRNGVNPISVGGCDTTWGVDFAAEVIEVDPVDILGYIEEFGRVDGVYLPTGYDITIVPAGEPFPGKWVG